MYIYFFSSPTTSPVSDPPVSDPPVSDHPVSEIPVSGSEGRSTTPIAGDPSSIEGDISSPSDVPPG